MHGTIEPVPFPAPRVSRRTFLGALGLGAAGLLADRALPLNRAVVGRPYAARPPRPILAVHAEPVGWVTGAGSANRTAEAANVHATDLGIMWDDGAGGVLVAYGDTFGPGWAGYGGKWRPGCSPAEADWRSNVLARSTTTDLSRGLTLDSWVSDAPGHACQVVPRDRRPGVVEYTVIPTAGVAIGGRNLLSYMSVRAWVGQGRWDTNYAGIAYSDDRGATWHKPESAQWANTADGTQGWQMCAFARERGRLYVFGTPNGRWGPVRLSRVREDDALDLTAYEYRTRTGWTRDRSRAVPVIPAPASELSVIFHEPTAQWLATHYHEGLDALVLHTAPALTGPWSPPRVMATAAQWPTLYGAFFHPHSGTAETPYVQMSQWGEYNTRLMRLHLEI